MPGGRADYGQSLGLIGRLRSLPSGAWFGVLAAACTCFFHALYGAMLPEPALAEALVWAALLAWALSTRWGRRELGRAPPLAVPGILFGLTIAAAFWSLTPYVPGGPHPAWSYVGRRGSAAIDPSVTAIEIVKLLGMACTFMVGVLLGRSDERARPVLKALVYCGAAFGAVMFVLYVSGHGADSGRPRFEANFASPNTAGTLSGLLLVLAVAATRSAIRKGGGDERAGPLARAGAPAAAALLSAALLIATASRGALTATAAALVLQFVWDAMSSKSRKRWIVAGAAVGVVVAVVLALSVGELALTRFMELSGNSAEHRQIMAAEHWKAFLASPLNGYGLGSFDALNRALLTSQTYQAMWSVRALHQVYIQWLEEAGLFGAVPMFLCIASILWATVRGTLGRSRMRTWLHALIACDLLVLLHGFTDFALQTPSVASLWALLLGVQIAASQGSGRRGA